MNSGISNSESKSKAVRIAGRSRPMRDSGVAWIGEVPVGWKVNRGKYELSLLARPVLPGDGVITCFRDGEVTLRSKRREEGFTFSDKECGYQGIEPGDLVVHGMDGFAGSIGISDSRGKGTPVLNVLDSHNSKKYLMYYLRAMAYQDIFVALSTGIRVRSCDLRWSKLAEFPFVVPPLPEQRAIAAYLDRECGKIDGLRAKIEQQIEKLGEYKKSLITEAVTGKKKVEKKVERKGGGGGWKISSYSKLRDSGVAWIGKVPEGWKVAPLKHYLDILPGYAFSSSDFSVSDGVRLLRGVNVGVGCLHWEEVVFWDKEITDQIREFELREGDLIFGLDRPWISEGTRVAFVEKKDLPSLLLQRVCRIRARGLLDLNLAFRWLASAAFEQSLGCETTGISVPHISTNQIADFKIVIPPLAEQREIAAYLDEKCGAIDAMVEKCRGELEKLAEYKKSLIFECVTGKRAVA